MSETADDIIREAIAFLLFKDNYWGYLLGRVKRISDENLKTIMAVSASMDSYILLHYNPIFVEGATKEFVLRALEHEGMHILNNHLGRMMMILSDEPNKKIKDEKFEVFGIAADCAVNCLINMPETAVVCGNLWKFYFPKNYNFPNGQLTEYYYEKLLEKKQKNKSLGYDSSESNSNDKSSESKPGNGSSESNQDSDSNDELSESKSENCESKTDKGEANLLDDHNKWMEDLKDCPDLRSMSRKLEKYTKDIVKEASEAVKTRGHIPGYIQNVINEYFLKPKVPYYQIISKLIKGSRFSKTKICYTKLNRKRTYLFAISDDNIPKISPFPGKTRDVTFKICIVLDTSGSMGDMDIIQGLSGAKNIIENDRDCLTTIIEVDTIIHKIYNIKRVSDIQFNVMGRGGTYLFPALEYAKKENYDVVLVFTDGYCEDFNSINRRLLPKKIIWVITPGGSSRNVNGVGFTIMLDQDKNVINIGN